MKPKSKCALLIILVLSTVGLAAAEPRTNSGMTKLKSLAGNWVGKGEDGSPAKTRIETVVSGTAVMETLSMSGMEDMISIYSADGNYVAMVHYCPTNNQPRMRAMPGPEPIKELNFVFRDAGNMPTASTGHQQKLLMRFDDENHLTESWTWRQDGKDSVMTIHFTRESKKPN